MTELPLATWQSSLEEMETALGGALAALDRYQAGWEKLLAAPEGERPPVGRLEQSLREWDVRLQAASELADSVERELNDKEAAVGRWQESIKLWQAS